MSALLLLASALGIGLAAWLPQLPPLACLWLLPPLFLVSCKIRRRPLWLVFCFALGMSWGVGYGHWALSSLLPDDLEGEELVLEGRVVGLPDQDARRLRFLLQVTSAETTQGKPLTSFPRRVQLSWYDLNQDIHAGDEWHLLVKLKRPRSFVNPGGFDYQVWQLRRGVGASGYVRSANINQRLTQEPRVSVDYYRQNISRWLLANTQGSQQGIMLALLLGDRSLISNEQWRLLQTTGTNHLVAISGLHVGFVGLLGWFLGSLLARLPGSNRLPPGLISCVLASIFALVYSALAGFSLPTIRALIMLLVAQLALVMRRRLRPFDAWCLALLAVMIFDPLAPHDAGFWLSFGAVAVLILVFAGRVASRKPLPGTSLIGAQWAIFIGLLVPLALLMQEVSLVAPLANMVAIPLVTFLVVPSLLTGALVGDALPLMTAACLWLADKGLGVMEAWLLLVSGVAGSWSSYSLVLNNRALWLMLLAVTILLLPRGLPGRWLAWACGCLALVVPVKEKPELLFSALDVGQGLALVVQTKNHTLVYDVGPAYGERFDAGAGILVPYLRRQGTRRVDTLVLSHNDSDHIGGLRGFLNLMPLERLFYGEEQRLPEELAEVDSASCHQQPPWQWDGVEFRFLPPENLAGLSANDQSCVLLITYGEARLLLPGDISRQREYRLLGQEWIVQPLDLLVAAHHGSRTSSAPGFVARSRPRWVIFSAGYRSQHGHPHPQVVERFAGQGSQAFNTANTGAIEMLWRQPGDPEIRLAREQQKRYWH
jgi:competence protein ComEC